MKKILLGVILFLMLVLPCSVMANTTEEITVDDVEIMYTSEEKVFGYFVLTNNTMRYIPELSYVINLLSVEEVEDLYYFSSINNIPSNSLEVLPKETKTVFFEYEIPDNLPKREYYLYFRFAEKSVLLTECKRYEYLGELGEGEEFLNLNSKLFDLLDDAAVAYNITLSPEEKEETEIKLSFTSSFDETITAIPKLKIYYPNIMTKVPSIVTEGDAVEFKPNKDTEFMLRIPALNNPGQYLVKVAMFDGDIQISNELELSCYVKGDSASIVNAGATLDGNDVKVNIDLLGSRISTKEKDMILEYIVYDKETRKILKESEVEVELNDEIKGNEIVIEDLNDRNLVVNFTLKIKDKLLSAFSMDINKDKLTEADKENTFYDITSKKHKNSVKALSSLGILSGYPDGTFRPNNNITRAEFTVIATRLGNSKIISEASKFNDVPNEFWAKDFINTAYKNKYLKGYGNGLFMPNNNVTYQEALTILVNILGYPNETTSREISEKFYSLTWPNNYIDAAVNLGLLKNISVEDFSKPATRQDVALLTLNAYLIK